MNRYRQIIQRIAYASFIFALLLAGCSSAGKDNSSSGSGNTFVSFGDSGSADTTSSEGTVSSVTVTDKIETSGNLSAGQLAQLTWGTSGLVEAVSVEYGDKVKEGDVMASLRADSVSTDMAMAQADLAEAKRDLDDLINTNLTLAEAQQAVVAARKDVEEAENNLIALDYPRASQTLIDNTQAQIWEAEKTLTLAQKRWKEVRNHPDGDAQKTAALLAMTNAQLNYNSLVATINWYQAKYTQADYDEKKAALEVARANLEVARRKRDIVKDGADPLAVEAAKAKVESAQATVNGMMAIAPFDGEVIAVQAVVGNSVQMGESSIAVVDRNTLKVDAQVDETSISSVSVGDKAEITMDSLGGEVLNGKVILINPIGTTVNGLVKYTVTVSVEPTEKPLLFGATASVVIYTSEPHAVLAVPINAVQTDSKGEYVVVIRDDGTTEAVDVVSGDLLENLVIITTTGNLKEGDRVQLGTSTSSSSSSSSKSNQNGGFPGGGMPPGGMP